jgi:hypothetical protein
MKCWSENLKEVDHFGDLHVDWWIILKWILKTLDVDWIHLAQDAVQGRAVVNAVMNRRVP